MFTFDENVPIPPKPERAGGGTKPSHFMHFLPVNQSRFEPAYDEADQQALYIRLSSARRTMGQRALKRGAQVPEFEVRKVVEDGVPGVRVWRTA